MELVLAIVVFTLLKKSIKKYVKTDLNVTQRFLYGFFEAGLFVMIVLSIGFFSPEFSWGYFESIWKIIVGFMIFNALLEAFGENY